MDRLSPQAYCYLRYPILSSGETMLQYTIQHLCFTGSIRLERRRVAAHARDPHLVTRMLMTRKVKNTRATRAEQFTLDLFPHSRAISLGQLRATINKVLPDHEQFKYQQMLPDLLEAGMLSSKYARTTSGKDAMQAIRVIRKRVDRRIDHFLSTDRDALISHLSALGSNIVLLKKETRDKLRGLLKEFPELALTISAGSTFDAVKSFDSFTAFESLSLGDSFDSGTDFGGFGGGDFGGGGSGDGGDGGDW